ncbi:MAG: hypothetical protein V2I33_05625, partial [Kangiellaceae bacterium]|nr:hypothetical protein [Kangiellaceae bacterium]
MTDHSDKPFCLPSELDVWLAPAKLNLMLHITGRNEKGFHNLQTVFQLLNYGDELAYELNHTGDINVSSNEELLNTHDNLVVQAAKALQKIHGDTEQGATIYLNKKLPMGGGIGGGSSNAATTLIALNNYWQC